MTKLRVRARAVDMLGRQQIAGIPTAIHELFKNSHDAYAERAEVDYFRRTRLLVLRDDGYGMTRDDVENRWLTLGTESRVNANLAQSDSWTGPKKLPQRAIMGEKGIGRLAIAVIAPITFLLSRAVRADGLHDLVFALVHWGLFEQPGLDISAIDVPIRELPGGQLPTHQDIGELIDAVQHNVNELRDDLDPEACKKMIDELERARGISPEELDVSLNQDRPEPLSLRDGGYGTHFFLFPVAPELNDDIDGGVDKEASKLQRNLLGFSNTMTGEKPVIDTEFRDHHINEITDNLIGPSAFFTPEEYEKADHHFEGKFDEYGQFVGNISVYGVPRPFICNWTEGKGRSTRCGPFSVKIAYVMGRFVESQMNIDDWTSLAAKTDMIGGVYIYRNGIRVLPYGNSDYDFLDMERRRSKSASDWFFSYRRTFGYVAISHETNPTLNEKAGREGFRENQAYRDFRAVLINLFQQLAIEFFRESSPQGDVYWQKKRELNVQAELLAKEKKKADARRSEFSKELDAFFDKYEKGYFETEADLLLRDIKAHLDAFSHEPSDGELAIKLHELEMSIRSRYRDLVNQAQITRPRGLALTKRIEKDWLSYERMRPLLDEKVLDPLRKDIDEILQSAVHGRIGVAQRREAALLIIENEKYNVVREVISLRRDAAGATKKMHKTLNNVVRDEYARFRQDLESMIADFIRKSAEDPNAIDEIRQDAEIRIAEVRAREESLFSSIRRQMSEIAEGLKVGETNDDRFAALEQRNQALEDQLDFYADHAQMGMAVGILQHEFERAARGLREAMRDLKPWGDRNPRLGATYKQLQQHFEHLDGYLKVLDPLGRRLQRKTVRLSGEEILNTIWRLFGPILEENKITLEATLAFRSKVVECRSSAVIGAFVNIIDNAIYWVSNQAGKERRIDLDADEEGYLISNSGPGIEERMRDQIFEFGETTKPGGRGMGLAVSQDVLHREGLELELLQAGSNVKPVFRIRPNNN